MSTSAPNPNSTGVSTLDPYLPSSPDEEQLAKVADRNSTASGSERQRRPESGRAPAGGVSRIGTGLSGDGGMSRADTFGFEGFEPQGFENSLLLEAEFGPLPPDQDFNDMSLFRQGSFRRTDTNRTEEPQSASTSKGTDFSRRSTGLATHSSQLMSPVLTDAASPDSGPEGPPSADKTRLLGGGEMSRISSVSTATAGQSSSFAQQTPALTTTSYDLTPNLADDQQMFPPITPSIHVGYHKRGDSPARPEENEVPSQKRHRGSGSGSLVPDHIDGGLDELEDNSGERRNGAGGLGPDSRDDAVTLSLEEQAEQRVLAQKNAQISQWLSVSTPDNADVDQSAAPAGARQYLKPGRHRRALSHSNPSDLPVDALGFNYGLQASNDARTPGPGRLLNENSGDEEDEDEEVGSSMESAPSSIDGHEAVVKAEELDQFPTLEARSPDKEVYPWGDPIYMPGNPDAPAHPTTANAAMARFMMRARDIETASRVATWGTMPRRMSDGDINLERVFGSGGLLSRLSINKERDRSERERDDWRGFRETVERAADRIRPKRTTSGTKRKGSEPTRAAPEKSQSYDQIPGAGSHKRKDSSASSKTDRKESITSKASAPQSILSRLPSSKRPKSPRINTSGFAAAITTQIGALGAGSIEPSRAAPAVGWRDRAKEKLGLHRQPESPEVPRTTSPPPVTQVAAPVQPPKRDEVEDDAEAEDDDMGVTMEILPSKTNIIPTFEGFKAHVREMNPRLPNYLVERLGQEQLRRYKKLVGFKIEHQKAKELGNCSSGSFCIDKGGQPRYFAPKNAPKEVPRVTGEDDDDEDAVADGIVSEAQFPVGLPMPPAKRLPAEFECPLCFQVKKFQKPSDWSKHVHEDLQPFTCTFQPCPDPKSFKRKADWVRHENERHRQLEWWQCAEDGCTHLCYRRDNFVQHLVREHKLPEPKAKNPRPNKPAVRGPAKGKPKSKGFMSIQDVPLEERVLYMVEVCRHETSKDPLQEPCRFCGNHCNSFKKLTVHLARHMESLSLPILELVKAKDVSSDTIISPIDIKLQHQGLSPVEQRVFPGTARTSPYAPTMDVVGTDLTGMVPIITSAGFSQPYPAPAAWSGQTNNMPGTTAPPYTDDMNQGWPASSGMFQQGTAAPYNDFTHSAAYLQHAPVTDTNMYSMNGSPSPSTFQVGMDQRPHYQSPPYVATDQGGGMGASTGQATGLEMQYDAGVGGAYSQAPVGPMYGNPTAHSSHAHQHPDQRQYYTHY